MKSAKEKEKVNVLDGDGNPLFNRLYDDGTNVLRFESGLGFVARDEAARRGWRVEKGWR